ncbi:MAG: haloacid dehalogenase [Firmicutes bacterium HGW-Firmicutes-8]|nr:MAG: haloacid dehalogenase [Firmicutes bacterium HGW-Firmicutes-8]
MNFKVVLFDLDGTLVNSVPLIRKAFKNVFSEMGIQWTEDNMRHLASLPLKENAKSYAENRQQQFLTSYMNHYISEHNNLMKMFPSTKEMLELLKSHGCRLGIVTSKTRLGTMACVNFLGITDLIDVIITDDDAAHHKPHPEPLIKALELLSAAAASTIYIGDSPLDIIAAKSAGIQAAYVIWGVGNSEDIHQHKPDYILENWDQLIELVMAG